MSEMAERRDVLSLGDWLETAEAAGVPYIPAELIAEARTDDLRFFDEDGDSERDARLGELYHTILAAERPDCILRWDICSSGALKSAMARPGDGARPDLRGFSKIPASIEFDDPRLHDVIDDWRHPILRVWRRPWLPAICLDGYPLEFRVFVENDRIAGISSYYPQRPLDPDGCRDVVARVAYSARQIMAAARGFYHWRIAGAGLDPAWLNCTLDFLMPADPFRCAPTFIEGGPPHGRDWGADSCCFRDGNIRGVALRDLSGGRR